MRDSEIKELEEKARQHIINDTSIAFIAPEAILSLIERLREADKLLLLAEDETGLLQFGDYFFKWGVELPLNE